MGTNACLLLIALSWAMPAAAHGLVDGSSHLDERLPVLIGAAVLSAMWLLYLRGVRRCPPRAGAQFWFHCGTALAAIAAFGPLDQWAETSTAMHMIQHLTFMVVVAPMWALAGPLPQWRIAAGARWRPLWRVLMRFGREPAATALVHGATVWIWHTPALYVAALDDPWLHLLEHASFLTTAWLFWWATLRAGQRARGAALLAMGVTLMHMGLLAALLTFGTVPYYGDDGSLADQQLAGLLMWVPGSLFYLAGAGWIALRWLGHASPGNSREGGRRAGMR